MHRVATIAVESGYPISTVDLYNQDKPQRVYMTNMSMSEEVHNIFKLHECDFELLCKEHINDELEYDHWLIFRMVEGCLEAIGMNERATLMTMADAKSKPDTYPWFCKAVKEFYHDNYFRERLE
tara:strand:+ start:104 stop:475 length:372 start_codon:yes stop_codon:yes gene_type:complete